MERVGTGEQRAPSSSKKSICFFFFFIFLEYVRKRFSTWISFSCFFFPFYKQLVLFPKLISIFRYLNFYFFFMLHFVDRIM